MPLPQLPKARFFSSRVGWAVALALSAIFLYFAFRGTDWHDLLGRLARANLWLVLTAMLLVTAALYLRARRWRVLLNINGTADASSTFWATALGYLGNYILPARAGEVLRSVAIARRASLSQSYVFATALSERLFDTAVLVLLATTALALMPGLPIWLWRVVRVLGLGAVAGITLLLVLPRCERLLTGLIRRTKLNNDLQAKLITIANQFLMGSAALVNFSRAGRFVAYTLVIWGVDSLGVLVTARSINLQLPIFIALLLIVAIALASAVPSTPGSLGISQFVATSVLGLFAIHKDVALAVILLWQAVIYLVMIGWGTLGAWNLKQRIVSFKPNLESPSLEEAA